MELSCFFACLFISFCCRRIYLKSTFIWSIYFKICFCCLWICICRCCCWCYFCFYYYYIRYNIMLKCVKAFWKCLYIEWSIYSTQHQQYKEEKRTYWTWTRVDFGHVIICYAKQVGYWKRRLLLADQFSLSIILLTIHFIL